MAESDVRSSSIQLAEAQHGVVATWQLRHSGATHSDLRAMWRRDWERVSSHVLRRRGAPPDDAQRVMAAVLDAGPGGALSHESASAWVGHRGSRLENPIHVSTERKVRRATLARVHEVRLLPAELLTVHDGVPMVCAELIALHVFATMGYERAERIVETMWSRRMLSGRSIGVLLARLARQGRNGIVALRRFHEDRGDDYTPVATGLESRARTILVEAGLSPTHQRWLGGDQPIGRVDFYDAGANLVVEVQSEMHHTSLLDRRNDELRIERLRAEGFDVLEAPEEWVWTDPARLVAEVHRHSARPAATTSP